MKIFAIETSCDETAAALIEAKNDQIKVLANVVNSQINIHKKFGGIVPEVAAREHLKNILPIINQALDKNKWSDIDYLAVTTGPGLITSLIVGVETAKVLAFSHQIPLVSVNHIEAHLCSNFINQKIKFPTLSLIVSGGHTQLILTTNYDQHKIIGQTLDDAAGECFDKVAKILKIGYPGGPAIEKSAKSGNPRKIDFPRPLINYPNFNFSFSGLKTSVLYFSRSPQSKQTKKSDICASFQQAAVDVLTDKTVRAAKTYGAKTVMLAGGVAANKKLRNSLKTQLKKQLPKTVFLVPPFFLCTDNALMIAIAGYYQARKNKITSWQKLKADPNWELASLHPRKRA